MVPAEGPSGLQYWTEQWTCLASAGLSLRVERWLRQPGCPMGSLHSEAQVPGLYGHTHTPVTTQQFLQGEVTMILLETLLFLLSSMIYTSLPLP